METKTKKCKECGKELIGRSDKKFCSDYCKNIYHNRENTSAVLIRKINSILRKNWRILAELNYKEKTTVHKDQMLSRGFNFKYFTSIYTTKAGVKYYFCYDQGYLPLENDIYMLVLRKEGERSKES